MWLLKIKIFCTCTYQGFDHDQICKDLNHGKQLDFHFSFQRIQSEHCKDSSLDIHPSMFVFQQGICSHDLLGVFSSPDLFQQESGLHSPSDVLDHLLDQHTLLLC